MSRKGVKLMRKIGVALIGFPIIILGIVLIPLPGPGFLVILLGLFILAIEFEWAERHKQRVKDQVKKIASKAKSKDKNT